MLRVNGCATWRAAPRRDRLKLDRISCSMLAVSSPSALLPNTRGSRNVPSTRYSVNANPPEVAADVWATDESLGYRLTLVDRFTDRFLPNRLRRPISKKARGAISSV